MMLQNLMENYLNPHSIDKKNVNKLVNQSQNPIEVKKSKWEMHEKRMQRVYTFKTNRVFEAFIVDILKYKRETDANIELRFKEDKVAIILHALSPSISEIEIEAAEDIDKIRKNVAYYFAN